MKHRFLLALLLVGVLVGALSLVSPTGVSANEPGPGQCCMTSNPFHCNPPKTGLSCQSSTACILFTGICL